MDFKGALKAHSDWKFKLFQYINTPDNSLDENIIKLDDKCTLGQWIYGEGKQRYSSLESFEDLKETHAKFHRTASSIVERVNKGEKLDPSIVSSNSSEYVHISNHVMMLIRNIQNQVV